MEYMNNTVGSKQGKRIPRDCKNLEKHKVLTKKREPINKSGSREAENGDIKEWEIVKKENKLSIH